MESDNLRNQAITKEEEKFCHGQVNFSIKNI